MCLWSRTRPLVIPGCYCYVRITSSRTLPEPPLGALRITKLPHAPSKKLLQRVALCLQLVAATVPRMAFACIALEALSSVEHSTLKKIGFDSHQLALLLASLPQHYGRCGRLDLSHPPPRACISNTVLAIRRPKILTAVTSSESAALWAVMTSR